MTTNLEASPTTVADLIKTAPLKQAREIVRNKLLDINDPKWLVAGMLAIFKRQTATEQQNEMTKDHNSRGFNATDAEILTSFSKQWQRQNWLSDKQLAIMRRKMVKYAAQLVQVARGQ